jgi:hypothetical protein
MEYGVILMNDEDISKTIEYPRVENDDPISSLLIVINKLVDIESKNEHHDSDIQEIQDSLRNVIEILDKLKK